MTTMTKNSMRVQEEILKLMKGAGHNAPINPLKTLNPVPHKSVATTTPTHPVHNKTVELSQQDEVKKEVEKLAERIIESVEELEKMGLDEYNVIKLLLLYRDLAPGDEDGPISIVMIRDFLENVIRTDESGYNKLISYYDWLISKEKCSSKKKEEKMRNAVSIILESYRTIENAYQYSFEFKTVADKMAPKLKAPNEMSVIDRVKWLRIWVIILCDQNLFWGDIGKNGKLRKKQEIDAFNQLHFYPESLFFVWREYLQHLPDESIIYEMMKKMIELSSKKAQDAVMRYGELDRNYPDTMKIEHIRNSVKKLLFPRPWRVQSTCLCTIMGLKNFHEDTMKNAVLAWKNGIENMPKFEMSYIDIYDGCKRKTQTYYQYMTKKKSDKEISLGVTCEHELRMYVEAYKWLLKHPDFTFGTESKTLEEYGMSELLKVEISLDEAISKWIVTMGFARDSEDVNLEVAKKVLITSEEDEQIFKDFACDNITANEVSKKFTFSSDEQAIACFSKVSKISANELNKMSVALKRVNMFGITKSTSFSDKSYVELFYHLLKVQPALVKKYATSYKRLLQLS